MTKGYKALCEELYTEWKNNRKAFCEFKRFQNAFLIEPYCKVRDGKNVIYFLNNNPGNGMDIQKRTGVWGKEKNKSYEELSGSFKDYFDKLLSGTTAGSRLEKMKDFATDIGFDGIEDVESFFLHSESFNKRSFLEMVDNPVVKEYTDCLTEYLENKPVVSINSISSRKSICLESIKENPWFCHIAKIMNLDFSKANPKDLVELKNKGDKITAAALVFPNKIMFFTMGMNILPNIDENDMKIIRSLFHQ